MGWERKREERRGEEKCAPVWIHNKLKQGMRERGEKGEDGLGTWM